MSDLVTRMKKLRDDTVWPHDDLAWPEWCAQIEEVEALQSRLDASEKRHAATHILLKQREAEIGDATVRLGEETNRRIAAESRLDACLEPLRQLLDFAQAVCCWNHEAMELASIALSMSGGTAPYPVVDGQAKATPSAPSEGEKPVKMSLSPK